MKINSQTSDEELAKYIREKDKECFSYIIDRYENKLKVYLSRTTNYSQEVDDLLQQTFINAYMNLQSFDVDKKFSSWIYRIAHNLAINWLKKKKINIFLDEDETILRNLASEINIFQEINQKELAKDIGLVINKLLFKYKEPIILKYLEEKSYEEISDILRMPKNTVGTLISRAKKILKTELKKYEDELKK